MLIRKSKSQIATFVLVALIPAFIYSFREFFVSQMVKNSFPLNISRYLYTREQKQINSSSQLVVSDINFRSYFPIDKRMHVPIISPINTPLKNVAQKYKFTSLISSLSSSTTVKKKQRYVPWSIISEPDHMISILSPPNVSLEKTPRPLLCNGCMTVQYEFLINNENLCTGNYSLVQVLILIVSAPKNKLQRELLRNTWLTYTKQNTGEIRYVFLLGISTENENVKLENSQTKDIIMGNFHDSYSTMTLKTLMGFKWVDQFCQNTKFVVKTDDDVYINIPGLARTIKRYEETLQKTIAGSCIHSATPIRDKSSKYYVSLKSYPQKIYQEFCVGNGFVTSKEVISDIVNVSQNVPYIYLDDVYVGLCLKVLGYKTLNLKGFALTFKEINLCRYKQNHSITIHKCSIHCMKRIWKYHC